MSVRTVSHAKAIHAAAKRLPLRGDAALLRNLDFACMDALEAYKLGVEEAQNAIIERLQALPQYPEPKP